MAEQQGRIQANRWFKSRRDRILGGICGGFAEAWHLDSTLVRILWMITAFIGGTGILAYLIAWIVLRDNPDHASLNASEIKKQNTPLLIGAFFFIMGFFLLTGRTQHWLHWEFPWGFQLFPFDFFRWSFFWPLGLVAAGVALLVFTQKKPDVASSRLSGKDNRPVQKRFTRSRKGKLFGGVCSGLAKHFQLDPTLLRIGLVIIALMTHILAWMLIYLACMVFIPMEGEES